MARRSKPATNQLSFLDTIDAAKPAPATAVSTGLQQTISPTAPPVDRVGEQRNPGTSRPTAEPTPHPRVDTNGFGSAPPPDGDGQLPGHESALSPGQPSPASPASRSTDEDLAISRDRRPGEQPAEPVKPPSCAPAPEAGPDSDSRDDSPYSLNCEPPINIQDAGVPGESPRFTLDALKGLVEEIQSIRDRTITGGGNGDGEPGRGPASAPGAGSESGEDAGRPSSGRPPPGGTTVGAVGGAKVPHSLSRRKRR